MANIANERSTGTPFRSAEAHMARAREVGLSQNEVWPTPLTFYQNGTGLNQTGTVLQRKWCTFRHDSRPNCVDLRDVCTKRDVTKGSGRKICHRRVSENWRVSGSKKATKQSVVEESQATLLECKNIHLQDPGRPSWPFRLAHLRPEIQWKIGRIFFRPEKWQNYYIDAR
jgi:hypothetical protein